MSLSHIWQQYLLKYPQSRFFTLWEFNKSVYFSHTKHVIAAAGNAPMDFPLQFFPFFHFINNEIGFTCGSPLHMDGGAHEFSFLDIQKLKQRVAIIKCIWTSRLKIKVHFLRNKKINLVNFSFDLPFETENQSRREMEKFKD